MNALEVRAALALATVYVLRMLGLFMVIPVIAVTAQSYPDYSPLLVGIAVGGYGLTQALLQIPMGILSDRWGRKPVILLGLTVFAVGSLIAATADTMWLMLVGRILQGAGAIAGAIMALAADVSRETQRAKVMAIIGVAIGLSFYVAVLLGPIIANQWGLQGIFALTGVLALACLPLVKWVVPNPPVSLSNSDSVPQPHTLPSLLRSPRLWRLNVSVMLLHLMITLLFVQLPVLLLNIDLSLAMHWHLYLPVLGLSILGLVVLMGISRGETPKWLLMFSLGCLLISFVGLATVPLGWTSVVALLVIFFTGFNYLEANLPSLVSSIAPAGQKGSAMGIYASFQFMGAFLGGVLSGSVSQWFTPQYSYWIAAAVIVVWLGIMLGFKSVPRLRRMTLSARFDESLTRSKVEQLATLPGVVECEPDNNAGLVYLKVTRQFDELKARQVIAP